MAGKTARGLFSIGEISKICHIPVKTLRYYDEIDLLKPSFIDPETHYRYYSEDQFFLLSIIKELKLFEFSLSDIQEFLKRNDLTRIQTLYRRKKKEVEDQIAHLEKIRQRIENRFEAFEEFFHSDQPSRLFQYRMELKNLPSRPMAALRKLSALTPKEMGRRCIELHTQIEENSLYVLSPFMCIFHEDFESVNPLWADVEVCAVVSENPEKRPDFIFDLQEGLYASVTCRGNHEKCVEAYRKLQGWLSKKGYEIIGPVIKIYLLNMKLIENEEDFVNEIQVQIRKLNLTLP